MAISLIGCSTGSQCSPDSILHATATVKDSLPGPFFHLRERILGMLDRSIDPHSFAAYGPPALSRPRARSSVVEHLTFNQEVVRSIRTGLTRKNKGLGEYPLLKSSRM